MPTSYIYNEADKKYYQKLVAYGEPVETNVTVDLNSQWVSDTPDDGYKYFKSDSYEDGEGMSYSQFKVTWSNLTSITFKYMSNSKNGILFVLKMDSEKFTPSASPDDIYLTTEGKIPETYDEFTIECDEREHHIWFGYVKMEGATDEDRGFIGVPKSVRPVLDLKQGSELLTEYKSGGVSVEGGKTYNINFNSVILPNGSYIVPSYEDYTKTEKTITYEYVGLGLPSGTLWAKCNIGASSETEDGVLFQWGELSGISGSLVGKYSNENYSWATYQYSNGSGTILTKYCSNTSYGTVDNIETLEPIDDAATQIMGGDWRMPTKDEIQELIRETNHEWITNFNGTGVNGRKFTSKTDTSKYIFIPAAGDCRNGSVNGVGDDGNVWGSSLFTSKPNGAHGLHFDSGLCSMLLTSRYFGLTVRGVRK